MFRKYILFPLLLVLLIVIFAGIGYWLFSTKKTETLSNPTPETNFYAPATSLLSSQLFTDITAAKESGDVQKVRTLFEEAQSRFELGSAERDIVDYEYAYFLTFNTNDPFEGIVALKRIAIDAQTYSRLARATAIENLGRAYFAYNKPEITNKILEEEPFATFLKDSQGNSYRAIIAMLSWGLEVRPTAVSALRVAEFNSRALRYTENASAAEKEAWRNGYFTSMEMADRAIAPIAEEPTFRMYMTDYYITKATTMSHMVYAGETSVSPEMVNETYKKAIALAVGNSRGFALFNYAVFLAHTNADQETLDEVTERIAALTSRERTLLENKLRNTLANKNGNYEDVMQLMERSRPFKDYVTHVQEADPTAP